MKKNKKSQIKIQEMAFMLVGVFLFFILAGLFAISIFYSNLIKETNLIRQSNTISAVTNLADSPEFSCTSYKTGCVDEDKLLVLINRRSYEKFWPKTISSLKVIKLSAFNKPGAEMIDCNTQNYPDCEKFVVYDRNIANQREVSSFIILCRTEYENKYVFEKCEIAKLVAGTDREDEK